MRSLIRGLIPALTLLFGLVLQTTATPVILFNGVHPDPVLVILLCWMMLHDQASGVSYGSLVGVGLDITSQTPLGTFSLTLLIIALLTHFIRTRILRGNDLLLPIALIVPMTFLYHAMALGWLQLFSSLGFAAYQTIWTEQVTVTILTAALLNIPLMFALFPPFYIVDRFFAPLEEGLA